MKVIVIIIPTKLFLSYSFTIQSKLPDLVMVCDISVNLFRDLLVFIRRYEAVGEPKVLKHVLDELSSFRVIENCFE